MDVATVGAAMSGLKGALDLTKIAIEVASSLKNAELKLQLAELASLLAQTKIDLANIQDNLIDKDRKIKELERLFEISEKEVFWEQPFYYRIKNEKKEGPYCQRCWEVDKKLIRVQYSGVGFYKCAQCKNEFDTKPDCELSPLSRRKFLA